MANSVVVSLARRPDLAGDPTQVTMYMEINGQSYNVSLLQDAHMTNWQDIPWNVLKVATDRLHYRVFEEELGYPEGGAGFDRGPRV